MDRLHSSRFVACCLLAGLALAAVPVEAGNDTWSVAGLPPGGTVSQLVVDSVTPSNLYAASGPGIFKSTDSGATWTLVFRTLNPPNELVIEPENPGVLYVAYSGDGQKTLFKTTDGGATWNEADNGIGRIFGGLQLDGVWKVAVDPVNDGVAYAATFNTGVYKTTDGGQHWNVMSGLSSLTSANNSEVSQIIVDPINPSIVYLTNIESITPTNSSTALSGLYVSTDAGATWNPSGWIGSDPGALTLDPADHTRLLMCNGNFYASTDSGATWTPGTACPYGASVLAIDPSNSQHLFIGTDFGGLYESTDGGTTQDPVSGVVAEYIADVVFDSGTAASPTNPPDVYVATYNWGLFKSTDGGSTWGPSNQGIFNVQVSQMLMGEDGILYLASGGSGVYKSPDQGVTWTEVGASLVGPTPEVGIDVNTLVEDPTANSTLYAGTIDSLFKTMDSGVTWTRSVAGMPLDPYVYALALDPQQPAVLYAALGAGQGLYKSVDGGASWSSSSSGIPVIPASSTVAGTYVFSIAVDPKQSGVVYAGLDSQGLYKSVDGGATWAASSTGMGATGIFAIAVDPSNSNNVYASASTGFYKSTDAGATWVASDTGLNGYLMTTIQIDPNAPSTIYLSENYPVGYGQPGYVFVSTDGGDTWAPLTNGASAMSARRTAAINPRSTTSGTSSIPVAFSNVVVDPRRAGHLFARGDDGRIYTYDIANTGSGSGSAGGSGGGSGKASGGGGTFDLLSLLICLSGLLTRRQKSG